LGVVNAVYRKLLSQQRARNAAAATAEAEEVIRSRTETPKLLKTVIKVAIGRSSLTTLLQYIIIGLLNYCIFIV